MDRRQFLKCWCAAAGSRLLASQAPRFPSGFLWGSPRGIYNLVMRITREYDRPIIEITECGCSYLDAPAPGPRSSR